MSTARYPQPPWQMHGFAVMCPHVVPAAAVDVPAGLEPLERAGRCLGLLAYLEYRPPSPLTYRELIWMPSLVRYRRSERSYKGYYVASIYVDHEASLAAGREVWDLPKQMARFKPTRRGVEVYAQDGTEVFLSFGRFGPSMPLRTRTATLQRTHRVLRFEARMHGRAAPGWMGLHRLSSGDPAWRSLERARPWGGPAALFPSFEATMQSPEVLWSAGADAPRPHAG